MDLIFIIGFIIWSFISTSFGKAQTARPYSFSYSVADPASGNFQGHEQHKDENGSTSGSYYHLAPDGMWHKTTFSDEGYGYTSGTRQMDPSSPFQGSSVSVYHYTGPQAKAFMNGPIGQSVLSGMRYLPSHDSKMPSELRTDYGISNSNRQRSISSTQQDNLLPSDDLGSFEDEEDEMETTTQDEAEEFIEVDYDDETSDISPAAKYVETLSEEEILDQKDYPEKSGSLESHLMTDSFTPSKESIKNFIADIHRQISPPNEYEDDGETLPTINESEEVADSSYDYLTSSEELTGQPNEELSTPMFDIEMDQLPEITEMENPYLDLNSLNKRIRAIYLHGRPHIININNESPLKTAEYEQSTEIFEPTYQNSSESISKNVQSTSHEDKVLRQVPWSQNVQNPHFESSTAPLDSTEEIHPLTYLTSPLIIPIGPKISMQLQQQTEFDQTPLEKIEENIDSQDDQYHSQKKNSAQDVNLQYYYYQNQHEGENQNYSKNESSADNKYNSDELVTSDVIEYEEGTYGSVLLQLSSLGSYDPSTRLSPEMGFKSYSNTPLFDNNAIFISGNLLNITNNDNRTSDLISTQNEVIHQEVNSNDNSISLQPNDEDYQELPFNNIQSNLPFTDNIEVTDSINPNDFNKILNYGSSETVKIADKKEHYQASEDLPIKNDKTTINNETLMRESHPFLQSEQTLSDFENLQRENESNQTEEKLMSLPPPNILPLVIILNPSSVMTKGEIEDTLKNVKVFGTSALNTEYGVKILSAKMDPALHVTKTNIKQSNDATGLYTPTELESSSNREAQINTLNKETFKSENVNISSFDENYSAKEQNLKNALLLNSQSTFNTDSDATVEDYDNVEDALKKYENLKNEFSQSIESATDTSIPEIVKIEDTLFPTPVNKLYEEKEDSDSMELLDSLEQQIAELSSADNLNKGGNVLSSSINNVVAKTISVSGLKEDLREETINPEKSNPDFIPSKNTNPVNNTNSIPTATTPFLTEFRSSEDNDSNQENPVFKTEKSIDQRFKLFESYKKRVVDILVPQILKTVSDMMPSFLNNSVSSTVADVGGSHNANKNAQGFESQDNNNTSHPSSLERYSPKSPVLTPEVEKALSQEAAKGFESENEQLQVKLKDEGENNFPQLQQVIDNSASRDSALAGSGEGNKSKLTEEVSTESSTKVAQNERLPESVLVDGNRIKSEVHKTSSQENPETQDTLFETQISQILNKLRKNPIFEHLDQESLPVTSLTLSENPTDVSTISILVDDTNDFNNQENAIKYITEELKKTVHPTLVAANFYSIPLAKKSQILQSDKRKGPKLAIQGRETKIRRAQLQSVINHPVIPIKDSNERYEIPGNGRIISNYNTRTRQHLPGSEIRKSPPIIKWSEILPSKAPASKTEITIQETKTAFVPNQLDDFRSSSSTLESNQRLKYISKSGLDRPLEIKPQEELAGLKLEPPNPESNISDSHRELNLINQTKSYSYNIPKETKIIRPTLPSKQFIHVRRNSEKNLLSNKVNEAIMKEVPLDKRELSGVEKTTKAPSAQIFTTEPTLISQRQTVEPVYVTKDEKNKTLIKPITENPESFTETNRTDIRVHETESNSDNVNSTTTFKMDNKTSISTSSAIKSSINEPSPKMKRSKNVKALRDRNNLNKTVSNKRLLTIVDLQNIREGKLVTQLRPLIQLPRKLVNKTTSAKSFGIYRNPNPVELKPVKIDDQMATMELNNLTGTTGRVNVTVISVQSRPFRYFSLRTPNNGTSIRKGSDKRRQPSGRRKKKSRKNSRQFRYLKRKELLDDKLAKSNKTTDTDNHDDDSTAKEISPPNIRMPLPEISKNNSIINQTSDKTKTYDVKEFSTTASINAAQNSIKKDIPNSNVKFKEQKLETNSQKAGLSTTVEEFKTHKNNASLSLNLNDLVLLNVNSTDSIEHRMTTTPPTIGNNATNNKTFEKTADTPVLISDIINVSNNSLDNDSVASALESMSMDESEKSNVQPLNANETASNQHLESVVDSNVNITTMETSVVTSKTIDDSTTKLPII